MKRRKGPRELRISDREFQISCCEPVRPEPDLVNRRSMSSTSSPAVVLLSGGLDSATTAAIASADGFRLFALSIDYGQRHRFELDSARRVAESLNVERHIVTSVDLSKFGGSALTDRFEVPLDRSDDQI